MLNFTSFVESLSLKMRFDTFLNLSPVLDLLLNIVHAAYTIKRTFQTNCDPLHDHH